MELHEPVSPATADRLEPGAITVLGGSARQRAGRSLPEQGHDPRWVLATDENEADATIAPSTSRATS